MSESTPWSCGGARRARGVVAAIAVCTLLVAVPAGAQVTPRPAQAPAGPTPRAGSWEIGGGVLFGGGFDLGEASADLTRNSTGGTTNPFTLFDTSSELGSAPGFEGRVGYYVTPQFALEGGVSYSRPVLTISITGDAEEAPDVNAEETLDRYVFGGSALWHFVRPAPRTRTVPFVFGGGGYLRELHQGRELVETGTEYHAGAGVKIWFGNARRRLGFRADAGLSMRDGGVDPETGFRAVPIGAASLIYLF